MNRFVLILLLACVATRAWGQSAALQEDASHAVVIGAAIGSPTGVLAVGGFYGAWFALRVSGGAWQRDWFGIQGDVDLLLHHDAFFAHGLGVVVGRFRARTYDDSRQSYDTYTQNYVGVAYDLYLSGFLLQIGLGFGTGKEPEYPNPLFLFQAGYAFRF